MVNRAAVILKYREPFIRWINEADPYHEDPEITIEDANEEGTVYLIATDDAENFDDWLNLNYKDLFESELEDWYTDESLWPKKLSKKMFDEWFYVECHSVLIDTVGDEIYDDEMQ